MKVLLATGALPGNHINGINLILNSILPYLDDSLDLTIIGGDNGDWNAGNAKLIKVPLPQPSYFLEQRIINAISSLPAEYQLWLNDAYQHDFRKHVSNADAVWLFSSYILPYLEQTPASIPKIVTLIDDYRIIEKQNLRIGSTKAKIRAAVRLAKLNHTFKKYLPKANLITMVTSQDANSLSKIVPLESLRVIPNGVDTSVYYFNTVVPQNRTLAFSGVMDYAPNVITAIFIIESLLPRLLARFPDVRLKIIGRNPHSKLEAAVKAFNRTNGEVITLTGQVPNVAQELRECRLYLCPIQSGTGIKNKLLEAMSCGMPCVVTPLAAQGINIDDYRCKLKITEQPIDLVNHISDYLASYISCQTDGRSNREYIKANHNWQHVAEQYLSLFRPEMILHPIG